MGIKIDIDNWTKAVEYFLSLDKRTHIDREMFEVELALNLHGVGTLFSCSGHKNTPSTFPYILISSGLMDKENLTQNLLQLVSMYYQHHSSEAPNRLIIYAGGLGGMYQYSLINQGSLVGLIQASYAEEFTCFAAYLKGVI